MGKNVFFFDELAIFWRLAEKRSKDTFFFSILHHLSPVILTKGLKWHFYCFAVVRSASIVIHSVKNASSEIGPELTLRPLATSCAKDYKGHSLVQTSFTELPNTQGGLFYNNTCVADKMLNSNY